MIPYLKIAQKTLTPNTQQQSNIQKQLVQQDFFVNKQISDWNFLIYSDISIFRGKGKGLEVSVGWFLAMCLVKDPPSMAAYEQKLHW